jgi:phage repressor protein C with HTH and peptisase S24 domain
MYSADSVSIEASGEKAPVVDQERARRLRAARIARGYPSVAACVRAFGWNYSTYASHENGNRNIGHEEITKYAIGLRVAPDWLAYGGTRPGRVQIEGYVRAGGEIELREADLPNQIPEDTEAPPGTSAEHWAAYQVVGDGNAPWYHDGDIVFVKRQHAEAQRYLGKLCVVRTGDDRVILRRLAAQVRDDRYLVVALDWATAEVEVTDAAPIGWVHISQTD